MAGAGEDLEGAGDVGGVEHDVEGPAPLEPPAMRMRSGSTPMSPACVRIQRTAHVASSSGAGHGASSTSR